GARRREALEFEPGWEARGGRRGGFYVYDAPPEARGLQAAGTVHHVAWSSPPAEHEAWRSKVIDGGGQPTPVIDRFYFKSIYFREPSGVLFEIATIGPGFTADEPFETLGESLSLPPNYEQYRDQVESILAPPPDPETFAPTYAAVSEWLDSLPYASVWLAGFSQGAVMSYALGLGAGRPRPDAIAAFSGFIPQTPAWEPDLTPPLPPLAIGHGVYDPVISVEFGR